MPSSAAETALARKFKHPVVGHLAHQILTGVLWTEKQGHKNVVPTQGMVVHSIAARKPQGNPGFGPELLEETWL